MSLSEENRLLVERLQRYRRDPQFAGCDMAVAEVDALLNAAREQGRQSAEALLQEAVEVIEPFAKIADRLTQSAYGPAWGFNGGVLEHEDFRRARSFLQRIKEWT